jgi:hypothetical protein
MVLVSKAIGQIPRATSGEFQYYGEIVAENTSHSMERAKSFFNQPFLVHWDTVARATRQFAGIGQRPYKCKGQTAWHFNSFPCTGWPAYEH